MCEIVCKIKRLFFFLFVCWGGQLFAQKSVEVAIADSATSIANSYTYVGRISVTGFQVNAKQATLSVSFSEKMSYMPFRPDNVNRIYSAVRHILPSKYNGYTISCFVENRNIEDLIPDYYLTNKRTDSKSFVVDHSFPPLVTNLSRPFEITNGLSNRHIALWQSHGKYYDQKQACWVWQRPRVMQTVEDLYTQSYVLPYLVPMLENAGANVLLPRERDTQIHEIIVDDDRSSNDSHYRERNDRKSWKLFHEAGFAYPGKQYLEKENPFRLGFSRIIPTITDTDEMSTAEWSPDFPEAGRYAVYVSYRSFPNSATDARYTVYHCGVKTNFRVNQRMGGGTWIYLGNFYFEKGRNSQNRVLLTNYSDSVGACVSADAVKFGGGMGNIARVPLQIDSTVVSTGRDSTGTTPVKIVPTEPEISHYPRFAEGARYWLQWAGVPDSVYSRTQGKNDYSDDFQSRGFWVNYLLGGSPLLPSRKGLNIPLDMALAFHSDAGATPNDSIVGTLGICSVPNTAGKTFFENGVSRWASRDLTDIVMTQIVQDVRKQMAPEWIRRGLWNKSYSESRVPEVPTMLLELLSHQNFADMRYGLDPRFRFTVSRAIYKGMLRYLSETAHTPYVVQPLPVKGFSVRFVDKNKVELLWHPVVDELEPTAVSEKYMIYTRVDDGDFDNGVLVSSNRVQMTIQSGKIYRFKITAVNTGGQSFPSEILSAYRAHNEKGVVLVVNGFDRLSAPASVSTDSSYTGFLNDKDPGVPYISEIAFVGKQNEFNRNKLWQNDDSPGFGGSYANYEAKEFAGNTFDYPALHGKAIKAAGYSFVSSSVQSVTQGEADMSQYKIVDLILGLQKQTLIGNGRKAPEFKTFPLALQAAIRQYCVAGGNLFVTGSYIASDLTESDNSVRDDRLFLEKVLKYKLRTSLASVGGTVNVLSAPLRQFKKGELTYFSEPDISSYYVSSPDAIEPVGKGSYTIARYTENNTGAAIAYAGKYKICAFGFPFETIKTEKERNRLMESVLQFFTSK